MKKIITIVMLCFVALADIYADDFEYFFNIKSEKTQEILTIPLTDSPQLTYSSSAREVLKLKVDSRKTAYTFPVSSLYTMYYTKSEDVPSAITNAIINSKVQKGGDDAIISGLNANETVVVYGANGAKLSAATADADGVAVVNLSSMPEGVIIIKTSKTSFKIMK